MLANLCLSDLRHLHALSSNTAPSEDTETESETEFEDQTRTPSPDVSDGEEEEEDTLTHDAPSSSSRPPVAKSAAATLSSVPTSVLRDPAVKFPADPGVDESFQLPVDEEQRAEMCLGFVMEALRVLNSPWDIGRVSKVM
jgi:hypothetical protein